MTTTEPDLLASINPRVRKSPFFDCTVAAGLAAVTCYNHMWLPTSYGDPESEYRRLTEGVAMWDVAAQRHIEVAGPAADRLVQYATTVDTSDVESGRGVYAPLVDHDATLINDPVLLRYDDGTWRFSIADSDVRFWLDAIAHEAGFDARVRELDTATLAVQGPRADAVLDRLGCGEVADFEHFQRCDATVDGISVTVSRSGWSNQGGCELFLDDPSAATALWDAVERAGEPDSIGPGAPNQAERIENVLLSYGTDTGFDANPVEVGLADHMDLDGPEFIGQAALRRIARQGPDRWLRGAVISGEPLDRFQHPSPVMIEGTEVGELRAAAWSPRFSRNLGLALVAASTPLETAGSTVLPSGPVTVTLVELPFDRRLSWS